MGGGRESGGAREQDAVGGKFSLRRGCRGGGGYQGRSGIRSSRWVGRYGLVRGEGSGGQ